MIFVESPMAGAFIVEAEPVVDERGWFARTYCAEEFDRRGLNSRVQQTNASFNARKGTLRGMHYQVAPHGECKLVRCTRGAIYDVIVDLRPDSASYLSWFGTELSADTARALYVPEDLAHGFLTLTDTSEVFYQMSSAYMPEAARGVRWDDPAFGIAWPGKVVVISERDRRYPDYRT
ncbi:MAG: dTDP-4-dehydrorhamnose 3,5-epimerase [Actinomycetota bacterium]|nr:dTDP-4-dehydrorhamnose 3,5-epimerase [Actinomycetota bacterium]